jgi:hypothetical protein
MDDPTLRAALTLGIPTLYALLKHFDNLVPFFVAVDTRYDRRMRKMIVLVVKLS